MEDYRLALGVENFSSKAGTVTSNRSVPWQSSSADLDGKLGSGERPQQLYIQNDTTGCSDWESIFAAISNSSKDSESRQSFRKGRRYSSRRKRFSLGLDTVYDSVPEDGLYQCLRGCRRSPAPTFSDTKLSSQHMNELKAAMKELYAQRKYEKFLLVTSTIFLLMVVGAVLMGNQQRRSFESTESTIIKTSQPACKGGLDVGCREGSKWVSHGCFRQSEDVTYAHVIVNCTKPDGQDIYVRSAAHYRPSFCWKNGVSLNETTGTLKICKKGRYHIYSQLQFYFTTSKDCNHSIVFNNETLVSSRISVQGNGFFPSFICEVKELGEGDELRLKTSCPTEMCCDVDRANYLGILLLR